MPTFYILYSKTIDRFYVGATCDEMKERLRRHNSYHKKGFTGRTSDWELIYNERYKTKEEAFEREKQVKGWKSRKRIEELIASV